MKIKLLFFPILTILSIYLLFGNLTLAQPREPVENIPLISECVEQNRGDVIRTILCIVRAVFVILGFIAIAVAGFSIFQAAWTFMTQGEKEEEIKKARGKIVYAVIGLVVAILSWAMAWLVGSILGASPET